MTTTLTNAQMAILRDANRPRFNGLTGEKVESGAFTGKRRDGGMTLKASLLILIKAGLLEWRTLSIPQNGPIYGGRPQDGCRLTDAGFDALKVACLAAHAA